MKFIYTAIIVLLLTNCGLAQTPEYGSPFEFDTKNEKDPQFVLKDNYNTYLLTVLDVYGMMAGHEVTIRKFDQKDALVDTYKYTFPKIDANTFYQYLGFAESGTGKVAVFVEGHAGKANKSEVYKIEFDKATAKFTSTVLATNTIASMSKAGYAGMERSDNGRFVGIIYTNHREKGEPEKNTVMVIDATTLNIAWQKEVSFADEFTSQNFVVTNAGKMVLQRDMKGSKKGITYLVTLTASEQEEKHFEERIFLNEMRAVSIGAEDYIVAFNSDSKNFRSDYYNSLLLYDLKQGKILANTKIREFSSVADLTSVSIRNVFIQNNELDVFTEAVTEVRIKPTPGAYASPGMLEPKYKFGPGTVFAMGLDGQLKLTKNIEIIPSAEAYLYHSYGVTNIRGTYYINIGGYGGVYQLNPATFGHSGIRLASFGNGGKYINQLFAYFPDSKSVLAAMAPSEGQMQLIRVGGVQPK